MQRYSFAFQSCRQLHLPACGPLRSSVCSRMAVPYRRSRHTCARGRHWPVGTARGASLWRSGAERADCLAVLGLAAASRNSLRSLRSLRSDSRDENEHERASRWPQALRSSAPQRRATRCPHRPVPPGFWSAGVRAPDFPAAKHLCGRGGWLRRSAESIRACHRATRSRIRGRANPMVCCNTICARLQAERRGRPPRWPSIGHRSRRNASDRALTFDCRLPLQPSPPLTPS